MRGATNCVRSTLKLPGNFNPRTPCGVRHADNKRHERAEYISIHAPLAGCDRLQAAGWREGGISIHAPLAGCDSPPAHGALFVDISIHAPLAGCDNIQCVFAVSACYFNPRTPCGVRRRLSASATPPDNHFNPRTPCGVRRAKSTPAIFFVPISIHAPLAGCDVRSSVFSTSSSNFNPRTPCGVRPFIPNLIALIFVFQSTHPLRGATGRGAITASALDHFNPRTPCGVRLAGQRSMGRKLRISIHAPLAGCDGRQLCRRHAKLAISIHAPLAGCDGSEVRRNTVKPNFNPRTPCGVRQTGLAGDTSWTAFQSTHPLRGATAKLVAQYIESGISIHAPLAGCDFFSPPTRCV